MNIKAVILDDDSNSAAAATVALKAYDDVEVAGCFAKISELFDFLETEAADLAFLDIELNEETGFSAARQLKRDYPDIMIVFLTGHSSYAIDGYDFEPVNFLTKPINESKLEQTIIKVRERMSSAKQQRSAKLMFRLQQGSRIIDVRDICYIERRNRRNYMYTEDEALCIAGYSIHELDEMLSPYGFFLCHQSFLISLYRVENVRDVGRQLYEAVLRDCERPIPVSRHRYEDMNKHLRSIGVKFL